MFLSQKAGACRNNIEKAQQELRPEIKYIYIYIYIYI